MKYYIATKLENHAEHNRLCDMLTGLGHEITYDWTLHGPVYKDGLDRVSEVAQLETKGVLTADVIIVLWPGGRGTHVELGMALAADKRVILVSGYEPHHESSPETCAFYHHPLVKLLRNVAEVPDALTKIIILSAAPQDNAAATQEGAKTPMQTDSDSASAAAPNNAAGQAPGKDESGQGCRQSNAEPVPAAPVSTLPLSAERLDRNFCSDLDCYECNLRRQALRAIELEKLVAEKDREIAKWKQRAEHAAGLMELLKAELAELRRAK